MLRFLERENKNFINKSDLLLANSPKKKVIIQVPVSEKQLKYVKSNIKLRTILLRRYSFASKWACE